MHIDNLLSLAVQNGASDLHMKVGSYPMIRVDGTLVVASEERRLEQDDLRGMARTLMSPELQQEFETSQEVDCAYSVPGLGRFRCNVFRQRGTVGMVIRVIPTAIPTIDDLELPPVLRSIAEEERGLVLVTGTTGSGKSTTLAAMIDHINQTRSSHIITVEDPIEYLHRDHRSLVNQRELHVDTSSFAHALRSALRQDPDVILVGEIRDLETAQIAVQASLTGHLVLATLHTNDAPSAITRLIDIGIEPYLITSSLVGVLAQRLVRRICPACKGTGQSASGGRCEPCFAAGYKGRLAVYELMTMTDTLRRLTAQNADAVTLFESARDSGFRSMREDAADKVAAGHTDEAEVYRVLH